MLIQTFKKLKVYFVPENFQNDILVFRKAENVIEVTLVGIVFLLFLIPFNFLMGLKVSAWVNIFAVLYLFGLLYAYKRNLKYIIFANALSLAAYAIVVVATMETGGISSPAISAYLLCGIIAFLYAGKRLGLLWTIIGIATIIFLGVLEMLGKGFISKLNPQSNVLFSISVNLLLLLFVMYIIQFYVGVIKNISKRNFLKTEKMERYNRILAEQQIEIESKNIELTQLYEQFNKQNQDLLLQKELLQTQNDELTRAYEELIDSIYYTKRIQMALLPEIDLMKPHFSDLMVLYKPKEILSGDFYWFAQIRNYIFLIVADCTGHGIPGAFMTVIGNDLLNHIIKEEGVLQPKEILERLDQELLKTLQQHEGHKVENITDGMDIAICRIDKSKQELCYCGAKRPLFIVNEQGATELKGSRFAIGGIRSITKVFEEHIIRFSENDTFYMSSDGFTDQFGGDNDSKFLTLHFKEKLAQFYGKPLEYQKLYLDELHETWKGFINEQTDDILIIGFRVSSNVAP
jgi:serine phosphatase RsbU (regulator of sigma subunit)